jgi:hypothetical protein
MAIAHGDDALARAAARVALTGDETHLLAQAREALDGLVDAKRFW